MSHGLPVNHRLRGLYRTLAGLAGVFLLAFGILGFTQTQGMEYFATDGERVLGLTANPVFAIMSIAAGALTVLAVLIGRNIDTAFNLGLGSVFLVAGAAMLFLIDTDANVLATSMTNCIASFVIGLVLFTAGLYGRVDRTALA